MKGIEKYLYENDWNIFGEDAWWKDNLIFYHKVGELRVHNKRVLEGTWRDIKVISEHYVNNIEELEELLNKLKVEEKKK